MMLVPTYLAPSRHHGIGIFSQNYIPKGTVVWRLSPGFDQIFTPQDLESLAPHQRDSILFYCYRSEELGGIVLCCDNARHFNFAPNPNCGGGDDPGQVASVTIALRDIQPGEELTYPVDEDEDALRKLGPEVLASLQGSNRG